jgi:hypothetical protein
MFLLGVCTLSLCVGGVSQSHGAGMLKEMTSTSATRGIVPITASASPLKQHMHTPGQHYSSALFKGEYVQTSPEGMVTIKQSKYPKCFGPEYLRFHPKIVSELRIDTSHGIPKPCHLTNSNDVTGPFVPAGIRLLQDDDQTFVMTQPTSANYFSNGRFTTFFSDQSDPQNECQQFCLQGEGIALDGNLVITSAHQFLPSEIKGSLNANKRRAEGFRFAFGLSLLNDGLGHGFLDYAKASPHCFIHPEWEKSFNPAYDLALIFLSDSFAALNQTQLDELLSGTEETLRIVEHPKKTIRMSESTSEGTWEQAVDSQGIVYHLANTLPESSGILSEDQRITGSRHARDDDDESNGANRGVNIRKDLLPFIEDSIRRHQAFLDKMGKIEELQQKEKEKEKQRQEQAIFDKAKAEAFARAYEKALEQAKKDATIESARKMLRDRLPISTIVKYTGLTEDEVREIEIEEKSSTGCVC